MFDLTKKIALITGASRGLGWSMAQALAKAGAHVVLNARDEKRLSERVKTLSDQGLSAQAASMY
jgi:gluconate 5-dehydrogenase